ncbi:MAG: hypothetical protein JWP12_690 [Bacteroidetes bacterium]|nr:hypothetical protein [Bacteroidota bacterium]
MDQPKRILICPLDWGLGHATRCIPIIRLLIQKKAEIFIAADGRPLELLKQEFPQLTFIPFKGYEINYPRSGSMAFKMLLAVPGILKKIKREHLELQQIIDTHKIDIVISDNRYGCWNKNIKSIFITHQLMIKTPFFEKTAHAKILNYIRNYNECWIPDTAGSENLSGDLSHKYVLQKNTYFIGNLSRFKKPDAVNDNFKYDVMAIVSGPEPQRSIFENSLLQQFNTTDLKTLLVSGLPEGKKNPEIRSNVTIVSHLNATEMQAAILNSKIIIARSGYSTIMDLAALGKKAVFVPTPGQTEQEYLAELLLQKNISYFQQQSAFDLKKALLISEKFTGFTALDNTGELEKRIDLLLK